MLWPRTHHDREPTVSHVRPGRLIGIIGASFSVIVALSVMIGYGTLAYHWQADFLDFKAQLNASRIAKYIYSHGDLWPYHRVRLAELIDLADTNENDVRQRVYDSHSRLVVDEGGHPGRPTFTRSQPIVVGGSTVGWIEIEKSLRPLLGESFVVAIFSFLLALAAFLVIRTFPLRVLNRLFGELETANATINGRNAELQQQNARLKQQDEELSEQNLRFGATLEHMTHGLCMFDAEHRMLVCNRRYGEMYNLTPEQTKPGTTLRSVLEARVAAGTSPKNGTKYMEECLDEVKKQTLGETVDALRDGRMILVSHGPMPNGGFVGIHQDITDQKKTEAEIVYMADHDTLTGIGNRVLLHAKLKEALARLRQRQETFAVLILDLDGFKYVNDTLGHAAGDMLLKELAQRLQSALREGNDVLTRLGGDEFAIIQSSEDNQREAAIGLALRVLDIVAQPFDLDGHKITVGTSIGIALAPEDGVEAGDLLKRADLALYRVKSEGRNNYCFFDAEMSKGAAARLDLLTDLRGALSRNEFELFYQPVFDAKTQRPCGAEALVRWRHPVRGLISPDRFIPLAEETGLMEPLGEWIMERACTDAAAWPDHIKVAVNLSAVQFRSGKLFDVILCALVESGLPPERLELEITESVLMQNAEGYGTIIQQLKNIGISIALDDFGTGYSSLSYLTKFPFDKIKIDKSFTQGLTNNAGCAAGVASVLTLARSLDMIVTAEGIETKQQFELLKAAGVHQIQGYLFARPGPLAELNFVALEQRGRVVEAA
jgi:diguanylate cyclase (GGDEF)-like protein